MFDEKKKNDLTGRIIEYLRSFRGSAKLNQISNHLKIDSQTPAYEAFNKLLIEMENDGILERLPRRRFTLLGANNDKIKGTLFVEPRKSYVVDHKKNIKVNIRNKFLANSLHGDEVEVELIPDKKNKLFGRVSSVITRNEAKIKGKVEFDGDEHFLVPESDHYLFDFFIPEKYLNGAVDSDLCIATIQDWTDPQTNPTVKIDKVILNLDNNEYKFDSIVAEFELPTDFEPHVYSEIKDFEPPNSKTKFGDRIDLRKEDIITIDPDDAKDFDDALSLRELENGNLELGVHIADVTHYVSENSELDIEARNRGNSVYLADRVVPMLPEKLSNNICSLVPHKIRLAHSVFIEYNKNQAVVNYKIAETVIRSKRRFTYDEVLNIINGEDGDYKDLLMQLYNLSRKLRERRFRTGGIDFETSEVRFKFNDKKEPVEAKIKHGNDATQLVEECMLAANQVVAKHFTELRKRYDLAAPIPAICRIHEKPEPERINEAMDFVSGLGPVAKKKNLTSKDINKIIASFNGKPESELVNSILIRSLPKAFYDGNNNGHFGLGFSDYTHFTSPIRRYADLIVHRFIKEFEKEKPEIDRLRYLKIFTQSVSKHISETERHAMDAERASIKLTQAIIMSDKLGDVFDGTISGTMSYGIFVTVDEFFAEGLVRIKNVNDDYYYFDEKHHRFVGKHTKKQLKIGGRIKVKLTKVNVDKRLIDFDFVEVIED